MNIVRSCISLLIVFFITACGSTNSEPQAGQIAPNLIIKTQEVSYVTDASFLGYLAQPNDDDRHPAVILIHESSGLNDDMRDYARRFAEQGYVALAVDLYAGKYGNTPEEAEKLAAAVRENLPQSLANLQAAVDYLSGLEAVDDEDLVVAGWSFGSDWSQEQGKNDLGVRAVHPSVAEFLSEVL